MIYLFIPAFFVFAIYFHLDHFFLLLAFVLFSLFFFSPFLVLCYLFIFLRLADGYRFINFFLCCFYLCFFFFFIFIFKGLNSKTSIGNFLLAHDFKKKKDIPVRTNYYLANSVALGTKNNFQ